MANEAQLVNFRERNWVKQKCAKMISEHTFILWIGGI